MSYRVFFIILSINICFLFDSFTAFQALAEEIPDSYGNIVHHPDKKFDSFGGGFGESKRNFDEIGRSLFRFTKKQLPNIYLRDLTDRNLVQYLKNQQALGLNSNDVVSASKRNNFDEISRSSFGFYRRSPPSQGSNWRYFSNFGKRQLGNSEPNSNESAKQSKKSFDEIGRSAFGFNG